MWPVPLCHPMRIAERSRRIAHRKMHARAFRSDVARKAGLARRRIPTELVEQLARVGDAPARGERTRALQLERGASAGIVEPRAENLLNADCRRLAWYLGAAGVACFIVYCTS